MPSEPESISARFKPIYAKGRGSHAEYSAVARHVTNTRLKYIAIVAIVVTIVLVGRLFYLQVFAAPTLSETARNLRTQTYVLQAHRGDIVDSDGAILATSLERYNVRVDQLEIQSYVAYDEDGKIAGTGAAAAAKKLAPVVGMDEAELGGILMGGEEKSRWHLLLRNISPEKWREINDLGVWGIFPENYVQRTYPNGDVAGDILGYVGVTAEDDTPAGRAGIEAQFNDVLKGEPGSLTVEVGPSGTVFPQSNRSERPAVDGGKVQLTIDRDIQAAAQDALRKAVEANGAEWAASVVVEIGTGRVISLASSESPDPGEYESVDPAAWTPRSIGSVVEPGSTGKVITLSALLNEKAVSPLDVYNISDTVTMPNGESFKDSESHESARMTVAGIIARSYNTGMVQMGDKISDEKRFEYMRAFGLGQKTGIEVPGEVQGLLSEPSTWDKRTHYTTMFGQAWAATPIQLAQMIAIIGNDGVNIPLHIVDGTYDADGNYSPTVVPESKQVLSADVAQEVNKMLQGVTQKGSTGILSRIDGYNVSGKTGTAEMAGDSGSLSKRVGTYVGLVPAEDPQFAISVVVFNPTVEVFGGVTAGPVFAEIGAFVAHALGVTPSTEKLVKYPWFEEELSGATK